MLLLIAVTSAGGYVVGVRRLGLRRTSLRAALGTSLECIGLAFMFLVLNTVLGVALVLAVRAVGPTFVSLYIVSDPLLAVLSLFQAIAFQAWLDSRRQPPPQ